jgi:putative restriction endonuclease
MTGEELLARLARLRRARVGGVRVPHKPLLLLWLFGRLASTGNSAATYADAEEPVSRLINEFGPPIVNRSAARQRAAMPFVHLERDLWQLRDRAGNDIEPQAPERRGWLREHEAVGRLRPEVEQTLDDPGTLAAAARLLLDMHFTPALADLICDAVGLDLPGLETRVVPGPPAAGAPRRVRRVGFAEEVLRAYAYRCAMCGYDGALGRNPVGIQAAHVRWHSQGGPDELANGLALCALHHVLFDLGVLGLTPERRIRVCDLYVTRSDAGRAVDALAHQPLAQLRPGQPTIARAHIDWHTRQVFKTSTAAVA